MKKSIFNSAVFTLAILLLASTCLGKGSAATKPVDETVSLELKFTKKRQSTFQRVFSFLDYGPNGFATGFLVGDGLVMTAYHVVSGKLSVSKKAQLGFAPNDELEVKVYVYGCRATVIKVDEDADLALLRVCQSQRKAKTPSFQETLNKDEKLMVIARPRGDRMVGRGVFYGPSLVHGQEYRLAKIDGRDGFSGSPVYNQKAEIIGVFSGYDREQRLAVISPESEHKSYSKNI